MPFQTSTQTRFRSQPVRSKPSCILGVVRTVPSRSYDQPWNGQTSRARQAPRSSRDERRAPVAADVVERVHRALLAADDDHAVAGELEADVLAASRDLGLVADEPPVAPPEPFELERVVLGIDVLVSFEAELRELGDRDLDGHLGEKPPSGGLDAADPTGGDARSLRSAARVELAVHAPAPVPAQRAGRSGRPVSVVFWGHRRDGTPPAARPGRKGLPADGVRD